MRVFLPLLRYNIWADLRHPFGMLLPMVLFVFMMAVLSYLSQALTTSPFTVFSVAWLAVMVVMSIHPPTPHMQRKAWLTMLVIQPVLPVWIVAAELCATVLCRGISMLLAWLLLPLLFADVRLSGDGIAVAALGIMCLTTLGVVLRILRGNAAGQDLVVVILGLPLYFPILLFAVAGCSTADGAAVAVQALSGVMMVLLPAGLWLATHAIRQLLEE